MNEINNPLFLNSKDCKYTLAILPFKLIIPRPWDFFPWHLPNKPLSPSELLTLNSKLELYPPKGGGLWDPSGVLLQGALWQEMDHANPMGPFNVTSPDHGGEGLSGCQPPPNLCTTSHTHSFNPLLDRFRHLFVLEPDGNLDDINLSGQFERVHFSHGKGGLILGGKVRWPMNSNFNPLLIIIHFYGSESTLIKQRGTIECNIMLMIRMGYRFVWIKLI